MTTDIFLDSNGISQAVKIPKRDIGHYVKKYGLPAFRESAKSSWKATPGALTEWAKEHSKRFLGEETS